MPTEKQIARYISRAVIAARTFGLPIQAVSMDVKGSFAEAILAPGVNPIASQDIAERVLTAMYSAGINPDHTVRPADAALIRAMESKYPTVKDAWVDAMPVALRMRRKNSKVAQQLAATLLASRSMKPSAVDQLLAL
jgi:hypothetical protein